VAAVDGGGPGIYNVVGDEPAPVREWLPFLAEQPGAAQADEGPPGPPHRGSAAGRRGRSGQTGLTP
jgi:hypothetical protein